MWRNLSLDLWKHVKCKCKLLCSSKPWLDVEDSPWLRHLHGAASVLHEWLLIAWAPDLVETVQAAQSSAGNFSRNIAALAGASKKSLPQADSRTSASVQCTDSRWMTGSANAAQLGAHGKTTKCNRAWPQHLQAQLPMVLLPWAPTCASPATCCWQSHTACLVKVMAPGESSHACNDSAMSRHDTAAVL